MDQGYVSESSTNIFSLLFPLPNRGQFFSPDLSQLNKSRKATSSYETKAKRPEFVGDNMQIVYSEQLTETTKK